MLNLSAAHLREMRASINKDKPRRLVWVDIGGGTGWNIEAMDLFYPIANFDAVYLVDLCEPLLDVARRRFARKGWTNVHCICADAAGPFRGNIDQLAGGLAAERPEEQALWRRRWGRCAVRA